MGAINFALLLLIFTICQSLKKLAYPITQSFYRVQTIRLCSCILSAPTPLLCFGFGKQYLPKYILSKVHKMRNYSGSAETGTGSLQLIKWIKINFSHQKRQFMQKQQKRMFIQDANELYKFRQLIKQQQAATATIGRLRGEFNNNRYQFDLSVSSFIGNKDLTKEIVRQIVGEEVPFNKYTLSNVSNLLAAHFQQYSLF